MLERVDWVADAAVMLWGEGDDLGFEGGGTLWAGPLADAVAHVLGLPEKMRERAQIVVTYDGGTRKTWLNLADIEALALQPDYPGRLP